MLLSVFGAKELERLARDLRAAGDPKHIRMSLRRNITSAMKPMQRAAQGGARSIPTHGRKHTGLRGDIAKATRIKVRASSAKARVRLAVEPSKMPEGKETLPAYMEGIKKRWRHPLFGDVDTWVSQASHPYFWPAVRPHIGDVREAVVKAVEDAVSKLD